MIQAGPDDDFGWFCAADFNIVLGAIARHKNPERIVLVGGQSLIGWALHYGIDIPTTEYPALTQDADFLGTRKDAEFLAKEIGAQIRVATLDDHTPNTAVLAWPSPVTGKILTLDFLLGLIGVATEDIKKMAVTLQFEGQEPVHILHPLLCLVSRFENLLRLKIKRTGNGIAQARVAVEVVKMYVMDRLSSGTPEDEKEAIRAANQIARTARSTAGVFVYFQYGIDVMTAVDPSLFKNFPLFEKKDWPNSIRWTARERWKENQRRRHDRLLPNEYRSS